MTKLGVYCWPTVLSVAPLTVPQLAHCVVDDSSSVCLSSVCESPDRLQAHSHLRQTRDRESQTSQYLEHPTLGAKMSSCAGLMLSKSGQGSRKRLAWVVERRRIADKFRLLNPYSNINEFNPHSQGTAPSDVC